MAVESATYIADLNSSNPGASDFIYEGDDHLRLVKAVLKASFPNITGAVTATHTALNSAGTPSNGSWLLQASTTISGTPSTVDFVHGTNGVVINANSDEYLIDFNWIRPSTAAILQLQASNNGGAGWTNLGSITAQNIMVSSGVVSATFQGASTVRLTGNKNVAASAGGEASGQVSIVQHDQGASGSAKVHAWVNHSSGAEACHTMASSGGGLETGLGTQLNGFRLSWSAGTFANTGGVVRLFSRKIA